MSLLLHAFIMYIFTHGIVSVSLCVSVGVAVCTCARRVRVRVNFCVDGAIYTPFFSRVNH